MPTVELVNITSLCPPRPGTTIAYGISFPITAVQPVPLPQSPSMTFRQMVAGSAFSCVLMNSTTDGADFLFCFGDGGSIAGGVLHSNPPELFPVIVPLRRSLCAKLAPGRVMSASYSLMVPTRALVHPTSTASRALATRRGSGADCFPRRLLSCRWVRVCRVYLNQRLLTSRSFRCSYSVPETRRASSLRIVDLHCTLRLSLASFL